MQVEPKDGPTDGQKRRKIPRISRSLTIALVAFVALAAIFLAVGCSQKEADDGKTLIIYSGRKEKLFKPVVAQFEKKTGIKVLLKQGKTAELGGAIIEEGGKPQADLFLSQEAGVMAKLDEAGVLVPYKSEHFEDIPEEFRSEDGTWTGVSGRARIMMYNTEMLDKNELPDSVFDLAEPKWKGKIAMASSSEASVIGWVSALREAKGDDFTRKYLRDLKNNDIEVLENHVAVAKAVGKGEFAVGLVNHYYFHQEKKTGKTPVESIYPDQGIGEIGDLVNVSAIAILKGAKHEALAKQFIDFLITPEAQEYFAGLNYEYPVIEGVKAVEGVKPLSEFKRSKVPLSDLGADVDGTLQMLSDLGYD